MAAVRFSRAAIGGIVEAFRLADVPDFHRGKCLLHRRLCFRVWLTDRHDPTRDAGVRAATSASAMWSNPDDHGGLCQGESRIKVWRIADKY